MPSNKMEGEIGVAIQHGTVSPVAVGSSVCEMNGAT